MKSQVFSSLLILLHTITAAIITLALTSCAEDHDEQFSRCSHLLRCGESVQNIGYPFWGGGNRPQECGLQGFQLKCDEEEDGVFPTIDISNQTFRVLSINTSNHLLRIAHNICPRSYKNTTLNVSPFRHSPDHDQMLNLFYACPDYYYNYTSTRNRFVCNINGTESFGYYNYTSSSSLELPNNGQGCELNVTVPVLGTAIEEFRNNESITLQQLLNQGFTVEYRMMDNVGCLACERSGGSCLSGIIMNTTSSQPNCLCGHELHHLVCTQNQGSELNVPRKIAIGIGAAAFGAIVMWIIFYMYHRRLKKRHSTSSMVSRDIFSYPTSVADLEKAGNYYGVHVFNYDELEEATNNFDSNKELGDGGFGTVYKGKLRDGRVVAIKRLYENNYKRVEQFMNEVEILTLLRHKNLVTLYGCTSYRGLVLVYEYIPNGTVADHLHGERAKPGLPSWTTRLNIAIETASALAYLHASGVIHRDVKTNNILLDANFSVKVADFGLSRLFPANATHVSTAPQGTPGYVDPEYHQYYHLTDRSDVYSFGVVLIELISSKPAVDITRHRHEINLSNMAVNKIQSHALHELVDPCLGFESDSKVKTMITAVAELAFQCLQLGREMRPSMQEVLEVLQGIQSNNSIIKAEEMDIPADDVLLLKNDALACSPDSETVSCRSAIPYASG